MSMIKYAVTHEKKIIRTAVTVCVAASVLCGCSGGGQSAEQQVDTSETEYTLTTTITETTIETSARSTSTTTRTTSSAPKHYCIAEGCNSEATKSIIGFSGETEYYCSKHYKEMEDIINMLIEDVYG